MHFNENTLKRKQIEKQNTDKNTSIMSIEQNILTVNNVDNNKENTNLYTKIQTPLRNNSKQPQNDQKYVIEKMMTGKKNCDNEKKSNNKTIEKGNNIDNSCHDTKNVDFSEKEKFNILIEAMKSSNNIQSSKAVAEGFTTLINQINSLTKEKDELIQLIENMKNIMQSTKDQRSIEKNELEKLIDNLKEKLSFTEEKLNNQLIKTKNLKNNLSELQNEIQSLQGKLKESESSIQILKKEYKSTNDSNENIIFQLKKEIEDLKEKNKTLENSLSDKSNLNQNQLSEQLNSFNDKEKQYKRMIKESEISIYKLQLENQNYRDCIKTFSRLNVNKSNNSNDLNDGNQGDFNNENVQNDTNFQSSKSNFNQQYKPFNTINSLGSNTSYSNTHNLNTSTEKFNNINNLNIEELTEEIRRVEKNIQQYTKDLKECEYTKIRNEDIFDQNVVHNIIQELERQSDYLIRIKNKYNELYKKISLV